MKRSWIENLNPEQQQAVLHNQGPLLILAGAGSGKTTVLVSRTGRLIDEEMAKPESICVLTFTNKAAAELKHRVEAKLGDLGAGVRAGTFHSLGLQILKQFHKQARLPKAFGILDSGDSQALVKELLKDFTLADKADFDASKLLSIMSQWRARSISDNHQDDAYSIASHWVLPKYLKRLHRMGVVDFDELLLRPLELIQTHAEIKQRIQSAFSQVMVDEFQDTNITQMKLISILCEPHKNITVVGDDDQSIYGWRGACIDNILTFPRAYDDCRVIRLERNYRSTPAILNLANSVISKNEKRHGKVLRSHRSDPGDLPELFVYATEDEEVERVVEDIENQIRDGLQYQDIAILFRSNGQGALFEAELKRKNIPHKVTGGTGFFERKEAKDVLAYIRCAVRPNEVALRRILNTPSRGIGDACEERLTNLAHSENISLFKALSRWREAGVTEQAGAEIESFNFMLSGFLAKLLDATTQPSISMRLVSAIEEVGYKKHLEKYSKNAVQAYQRWRFVEILGNILERFVTKGGLNEKTIRDFLNKMELHDDALEEDKNKSAIQLMTLHGCKGLEFPVVYLVGLEEEIIPHRTLGSDVSEERRLFYVGVTRAQRQLILSRASQRKRFGKMITSAPSRFLLELPPETFVEHTRGCRPLLESTRQNLLAELYKKLEA